MICARHGSLYTQDIPRRVYVSYFQIFHCYAVNAHVAGHSGTFKDMARRGGGTHRAGSAMPV